MTTRRSSSPVPPSPDDESVPTEEATDPFDLARLRRVLPDEVTIEREILTVPVRRPNRSEFFRVNPDPEMSIDWRVFERSTETDREIYWPLETLPADVWEECRPVRLFTVINRHGTVFLWPAKLPQEGSNTGRRWAESALMIADAAMKSWVQMAGKRDLGAYELRRAKGDLPEPEWPDLRLERLLRLAFRDMVLDGNDHPVLREFYGEM